MINKHKKNNKKVTRIEMLFSDRNKVEKYFMGALICLLLIVILYILITSKFKTKYTVENNDNILTVEDITELTTEEKNRLESNSISKSYNTAIVSDVNSVTFWGDSFVANMNEDRKTVTAYLAALTQKTVYNCGVNGETLRTVASKQGGFSMLVEPFNIPSEQTHVEIKLRSTDNQPLKLALSQNGGLNPCVISGIEGNISEIVENDGTTKLVFTRLDEGKEESVKVPTVVITRAMIEQRQNLMIVYLGDKLAYNDINETLGIYGNMIDYLAVGKKEYLIIGNVNGSRTENAEFDKAMTLRFGRNYINIREYLSLYALNDLEIEATEDDKVQMQNGIVPSSLYQDVNYLTDKGNLAVANQIFERMVELGMQ